MLAASVAMLSGLYAAFLFRNLKGLPYMLHFMPERLPRMYTDTITAVFFRGVFAVVDCCSCICCQTLPLLVLGLEGMRLSSGNVHMRCIC